MDKDRKDIIMIIVAIITLLSGIVMSFLSFFLSVSHTVHDSVLWYFAQCLMYCASTFGLYSYVKTKVGTLTNHG